MKNKIFREIVTTKAYTGKIEDSAGEERTVTWRNTNKLLEAGFGGIKTGFTRSAGSCLCTAMSVKKKSFIIVVMNSKNNEYRFLDMQRVADWVLDLVT
jgi:D-alanyl-D-alanine carboxypeptidase